MPAPAPQLHPVRAEPDLGTRESGRALLGTFFNIAAAWKLSPREAMTLLGLNSRSTFHVWKGGKSGPLPRDTLERISYVLGIYKALQLLLPSDESADAWIRKPNTAPLFGGRSALERVLSGNVADLYEVRRYLDAQRGWN
jgi:antitoxin Xre/MbcA/ParS-like protein